MPLPRLSRIKPVVQQGGKRTTESLSKIMKSKPAGYIGKGSKGVALGGIGLGGLATGMHIRNKSNVAPGSYAEHIRNNILAGKIRINELSPKDREKVLGMKIFRGIR